MEHTSWYFEADVFSLYLTIYRTIHYKGLLNNSGPYDFHCMDKQHLDISQNIFCAWGEKKKKSHRFGNTWGRVNDNRFLILWRNTPLKPANQKEPCDFSHPFLFLHAVCIRRSVNRLWRPMSVPSEAETTHIHTSTWLLYYGASAELLNRLKYFHMCPQKTSQWKRESCFWVNLDNKIHLMGPKQHFS